jgi:hypothetical protein
MLSRQVLKMSAFLLSSLVMMLWMTIFLYAAVGMVLFKSDYLDYDRNSGSNNNLTPEDFQHALASCNLVLGSYITCSALLEEQRLPASHRSKVLDPLLTPS